MSREYIAVGPNCWGRGETQREAVAAMKRNWPSMVQETADYAVYSCPPQTRVTEFGELAYPKDCDKAPYQVARGIANRGATIPDADRKPQ